MSAAAFLAIVCGLIASALEFFEVERGSRGMRVRYRRGDILANIRGTLWGVISLIALLFALGVIH